MLLELIPGGPPPIPRLLFVPRPRIAYASREEPALIGTGAPRVSEPEKRFAP